MAEGVAEGVEDGLFPAQARGEGDSGAVDREFAVSEKAFISLALLQVNWDSAKRSHLDNFVPFTLEALRRGTGNVFTPQSVADAVREHFGIALPLSVVKTILGRIPTQKGKMGSDGKFVLDRDSLDEMAALWRDEQRYEQEQHNLASSLMGFAKNEFEVEWSFEKAEDVLLDYVGANASMLLASAMRRQSRPSGPVEADQLVVASWIELITTDDPQKFDYLLTLVKGSLLAAAVFDPSVSLEKDLPFKKTQLVLDTPVILKALGYEGAEAREMVRETLDLARAQKASLVCFDRTIIEAKGVLGAAAASLSQVYRHSSRMTAVARQFAQDGRSSGDVERLANALDVNLKGLGVEIVSHPEYVPHMSVDEPALEDLMRVKVKYASDNTLLHDLHALTAIHRMRGTSRGDHIETCRAVFITTNRSLVRAAVAFSDFAEHAWPLATLVDDLATIVWVKRPMDAPDLPRHRLLAACLSVLSPSEADWDKFLTNVERLRAADRISADEVAFLRHSQESKQALLRQTVASKSIDEDLVLDVLHEAQAKLRAPIEGQLEFLRGQSEQSETASRQEIGGLREQLQQTQQTAHQSSTALQALRVEADARTARDERLRELAEQRGRLLGRCARWGLMLVVLAGVLLPALGVGPKWLQPWAAVALAVLTVVPAFLQPGEAIENAVQRVYMRRRLRSLGLDDGSTLPPSARATGA